MLFKSSDHPAETLFHELNILKFDKLKKLKMRIFMWNILHDEVPETSKSHISIRERSYGNQNLKFCLPIANTNLLKRDIVYQGPQLWTIHLLIKEAKKLFPHLNLLIRIICCTINEKISFSLHPCTFIYIYIYICIYVYMYIYVVLYTILYTAIFSFTGLALYSFAYALLSSSSEDKH